MSLKSTIAKAVGKSTAAAQLEKLTATLRATDQRIHELKAERGRLAAAHVASGATDRPAGLDKINAGLSEADAERAWLLDAIAAARQALDTEEQERIRARKAETLARAKRTAAARAKAAAELVEALGTSIKAFETFRTHTKELGAQSQTIAGPGIMGFLSSYGDVTGQTAQEIFRLSKHPFSSVSLPRFPGSRCSDLRLLERPDLVPPLLALVERDNAHLLERMETAGEVLPTALPHETEPSAAPEVPAVVQPRSADEVQATIGKVRLT